MSDVEKDQAANKASLYLDDNGQVVLCAECGTALRDGYVFEDCSIAQKLFLAGEFALADDAKVLEICHKCAARLSLKE